MSDEQNELGRDAPADRSRTEEQRVPAFAGAGTGAAGSVGHPNPGPAAPPAAGPAWTPPPFGTNPYGTAPVPPPPPRKQRTMTGIVAAALIAGVVGGGAGFGGAYALLNGVNPVPQLTSSAASSGAVNAAPGSIAAAAATATPSTVDIRIETGQGGAEGSGVILTTDGNVLTNNHVVAGASAGNLTVTLSDGTEHPASVVGTSPSYDLAVIKIQGVSGLTPATLGRSGDVKVGQQVVAIGSPQGLTGTVTTGIVSAFDRTVQVEGQNGSAVAYNGLQTDAPINPGNSGGPLVNLDGQVVGINSAIATSGQNSGSIGLGFAIPVDQARRVAQEIMSTGTATKPVLGVMGSAGGSSRSGGSGALISSVQEGSPAAQAGIVAGDVVTKVGDAKVEDFTDLIARIGAHSPGERVSLVVGNGNGGPERTVEVTLGSQPDRAATTAPERGPFGN